MPQDLKKPELLSFFAVRVAILLIPSLIAGGLWFKGWGENKPGMSNVGLGGFVYTPVMAADLFFAVSIFFFLAAAVLFFTRKKIRKTNEIKMVLIIISMVIVVLGAVLPSSWLPGISLIGQVDQVAQDEKTALQATLDAAKSVSDCAQFSENPSEKSYQFWSACQNKWLRWRSTSDKQICVAQAENIKYEPGDGFAIKLCDTTFTTPYDKRP